MQRVVILGSTGSGKTTFGLRLAERLALPAVDLDDLLWLPGWIERPGEEFFNLAQAAANQPAWIIIGNYSKLRPAIWPRASAFIWLDYRFSRVFLQLLRRSLHRVTSREPACNGNIETWGKLFSADSIVVWLFRSYWRHRRDYAEIFSSTGKERSATYLRFRSPREAEAWLAKLSPR
jgi:adenylate kinase family enzyme